MIKDSGKRIKYKSGMNRDVDTNKPRFDLVDMDMFKRWANHMADGAKKYGDHNWKKANSQEEIARFKASAFRHFIQWFEGDTDEDHASAVFFNIAASEMVKEKLNGKR